MKQTGDVFRKDDYDSRDGFLTYVWGPSMWMTLHIMSMNYPCYPTPLQKKQYKTYFDSLEHILPCGKCRENLKDNLNMTNYSMKVFKNRDTLSKWVYDLHCCINTMLGKKNVITYEDVRNIYENFRARCSLTSPTLRGGGRGRGRGRGRGTGSSRTKKRIEGGCTVPVSGMKSQCVLNIVPLSKKNKSMHIHKKCLCRRRRMISV